MNLNLSQFIDSISNLSYVLINADVPYMSKDFPKLYPIGKDIDILTVPEEYQKMKDRAKLFATKYSFYSRRIIDDAAGFRLRFEKKGKLHFQIHIVTVFENLPLFLLHKSIQERIPVNGYFVPLKKYELIYRLLKVLKSRKKSWHVDYIRNNKENADIKLLKKLGLHNLFVEIAGSEQKACSDEK